jgi:urea carboxylase-associated protein 2
MTGSLLYGESLAPGQGWSGVVRRHQVLRLVDPQGGANVSALFYNRDELLERYNMPDTLKAQYTAFLTRGRVLMSDMGRVLCSIVGDSCGWHDTLTGHSSAEIVATKYGRKRYQEARNDFYRNARDNFLVELGKFGLGKQDIVPCVNFFSKVTTDDDGRFAFAGSHSRPGAFVELRAEMNVIVVLAAVPHPLDTATSYAPRPIELAVYEGSPPAADDPCRVSREETKRAFANTEAYFV